MKKVAIILLGLGVLLAVGFVATIVGLVYTVQRQHERQVAEGEEKLARMATLSAMDVHAIVIHDRYGREVFATIADNDKQAEFLSAMSDLVNWRPNHPSFETVHYVVLTADDSEVFEFEMCLKSPPDSTVYIYGVKKEGNTTHYLFRKKSDTLKAWFDSVSRVGIN